MSIYHDIVKLTEDIADGKDLSTLWADVKVIGDDVFGPGGDMAAKKAAATAAGENVEEACNKALAAIATRRGAKMTTPKGKIGDGHILGLIEKVISIISVFFK